MPKITSLHAREILDSRGFPTIEVGITTEAHDARAMVPSGASTGEHEAHELRDGDTNRYLGKSVLQAVEHVNTVIAERIVGMDPTEQPVIDRALIALDGTANKSKLGANAILGVSLACMHVAAKEQGKWLFEYVASLAGHTGTILPVPMMNVINGGKHADSGLDLQEFMIMPTGVSSFSEALRMGDEIFHNLKQLLAGRGLTTAVGDEGGFAPHLKANREAIEILMQAIETAGYIPGVDVYLALDCAASEMGNEKTGYRLEGKGVNSQELVNYYTDLVQRYPILSIEDGLGEDDWKGWAEMTGRLGSQIQLVGDDLFVTNTKRLERGIAEKAGNAILIKLNQIGTVTETIEAMQMASKAHWNSVVSHRSGETEDTTIADFVVGMSSGQIKTGSLSRSERIAKYNQLLRIEEYLGEKAVYSGMSPFANLKR